MAEMKTHLLGGVISYFLFLSALRMSNVYLEYFDALFYFLLCAFSSVLPDIDMKKSKIHRTVVKFFVLVFIIFALVSKEWAEFWFFIALAAFFLGIFKSFRHRKFLHSVKFGILYSLSIGMISQVFTGEFLLPACASFLGFFSHLVLDRAV